jgi:DNA-binding MarR family transcriptional regulator
MSHEWSKDLQLPGPTAATFLPPATVEETAWDILLALHSDRRGELGLAKLARLVSVSQPIVDRWLALLEQRNLITGAMHGPADELRAVLTSAGRDLLDRYWSATSGLQVGAHH